MTSEKFWHTDEGQLVRWRHRRSRVRMFTLPGEPTQKNKKAVRESPKTRADLVAVRAGLQDFGHGVLRAALALDLDFFPNDDDHPQLHHLAKRYLDVLGGGTHESASGKNSQVYRDDSQVSLLHVRVWEPIAAESDNSGRTDVVARPTRDVVDDLEFAWLLRDTAAVVSIFDYPDYVQVEHEPLLASDHAANGSDPAVWRKLDSWLRLDDQARRQEMLLDTTDTFLVNQLCRYPRMISGEPARKPSDATTVLDHTAQVSRSCREALLDYRLGVKLPPLPSSSGDSAKFAVDLRERLTDWLGQFPVFHQLQVPVKAIFVVIPPARIQHQRTLTGRGTDLDNLVRKVLPRVHDVIRPATEPWTRRFEYLPDDLQKDRRAQYRRLMKIDKESVTSFEVIELGRMPDDPHEGVLRLLFGNAGTTGSTWSRIADFIQQSIVDR